MLLFGSTFANLIVLASAITIGYSAGEGGESLSSSVTYDLDDSTSLDEDTILNGASIVQNLKVSGLGKNAISQSVTGNGYSAKNDIENSGSLNTRGSLAATSKVVSYSQSFSGTGESAISQTLAGDGYIAESSARGFGILSASTSSVASSASASLGQQAVGSGGANLAVGASQGADISEQRASMTNGLISSYQSLSAGDGVSASQTTKLSGLAGSVESSAISNSNVILASGSFLGQGALDAGMKSTAADSAKTTAKVSLDGATWIDDDEIQGVSSGNQMMGVEGLRLASPTDLGSFRMSVANMDRQNFDQTEIDPQGAGAGSASSYRLGGPAPGGGWRLQRWNEKDPNIKLWLKDDSNLIATNLPKQDIANSIANAANTWDNAVTRNLFLDGASGVELSTGVNADTKDGKNVHAFLPSNTNQYIAYARTYSDVPVKYGFYSIYESDVCFNSNYAWSTSQASGKQDVQSVATHELGHTIGLGDLYYDAANANSLPRNDPRTYDTAQVMNTAQRSLGSGDTTGVRLLYEYRPVALRTSNGQYVCSENGGGSKLQANRDWIGAWETLELVDLGNNDVALRAYNGQYVCAEGSGGREVVANRNAPNAWETFKLNDLGTNAFVKSIALKANNGQWICAEGGGGRELVANRNAVNAWETFKLIEMGENNQHWQAKDLHYVSAEGSGGRELVANRDNWNAWEDFDSIELGDYTIALRAKNGQYVCAEGSGGREVLANRDWIGGWETFRYEYLGNDEIGGNKFALRASNGQYLQADPGKGGQIWANSNDKTGWATFYMHG
ncbi:MAG: hypothetical protein WCP70_10030 [Methanothrix sp.]